ncbi:RING-H2 finger protein ATL52-like [Henckelia pumila]|uniref:RING-H2 finger protein ATL52-like n=1 Tax=Henckelia pumila TaxID=405737 RepID=UPI003C6E85AA
MGDLPPSPQMVAPPPSSLHKSNMPILYYGLVVVGTAAIVLALYNLLVLKWCTDFRANRRAMIDDGRGSSGRYHNVDLDLVFSFKYKKGVSAQDMRNDSECAVCLSAFEEGEEVRQLPICKHSFHAPCIDMWLYSHMNCPVCRCPVEPPVLQQSAATEQSPSTVVAPDVHRVAGTPLHGLQSAGMLV